MPWTVADVDQFKHGLTEEQKAQWVQIANDALERCLALGMDTADCEASAVRQANGVVGNASVNAELFKPSPDSAHTGFMTGYWIDPQLGAQLAIPGSEPANELHITFCYCGDTAELDDVAIARAISECSWLCSHTPPLTGKIGGVIRFNASPQSDGRDVFCAQVDVPGLAEFREKLAQGLAMAGCPPSTAHGFTPHITLAYLEPGMSMPTEFLPDLPIAIDALDIAIGDRRTRIPLNPLKPREDMPCSCGCNAKRLTTHKAASNGAVRHETLDGRPHLVVPVVAIVEGVLNNVYVPADVIARSLPSWNGRPTPIRHPSVDGQNVSANSPDIIEQQVIGNLYNMWFQKDRMGGEMWLDVEKAERVGAEQVLTRFEAGEMVEVSTGYWGSQTKEAGVFNNVSYGWVLQDILPDHLAILLDDVGACSIEDGCGAPRTNSRGANMNELEKVEAESVTAPPATVNAQAGGEGSEKQPVANMEMTPDGLLEWLKGALASLGIAVPSAEKAAVPPTDAMPVAGNAAKLDPAVAELLKELGKVGGVQGAVKILQGIQANQKQQRESVVAGLLANGRNEFTREELEAKSDDELAKIQRLLKPASYLGQGLPRVNQADEDEHEYVSIPKTAVKLGGKNG